MTTNRHNSFLLLLLLCPILLAGCQSADPGILESEGSVIINEGEPVTIAVASALGLAGIDQEGTSILNAAQLAAQDFGGSINGHPIKITGIDSGCDPDSAASAANEIVKRTEILGVIGHMCSSGCASSIQIFSDAGISSISPGCEAGSLTDPISHNASFLRTMYESKAEALVSARFLYDTLGARKIAVINDPGPNDDELVEEFLSVYEALGGENALTINEIVFSSEWVNQFYADCEEKDVDVIYAPLEPFNSLFFIIHREFINEDIPIIGSHRLISDWFLKQIAPDISGIYAAGPAPFTTASFGRFTENYTLAFGAPPPSPKAAIAYDATTLLLEAIRNVTEAISQTAISIDRQELNEELFLMTSIPGVSGSLTCTEWGQCAGIDPAMYQIREGVWSVVYSP